MSACRSCGAPIRWALTTNGRRIPLDPDPVEGGNLALADQGTTPIAYYVDPEDEPVPGPLYVSHFATCPNAAQHRWGRS
jgi:hypothetical protein